MTLTPSVVAISPPWRLLVLLSLVAYSGPSIVRPPTQPANRLWELHRGPGNAFQGRRQGHAERPPPATGEIGFRGATVMTARTTATMGRASMAVRGTV